MINTGYLFAKDDKRLFINLSLGCRSNCSYCYLPHLSYHNNLTNIETISANEIFSSLREHNYLITSETLITLGCFSECFDDTNKEETIKIIEYFLKNGNQVQLSTKKRVLFEDLNKLIPFIQYYGQLVIFVSSSTISKHKIFEDKTELPDNRFELFNLLKLNKIPIVLYLKPVIKDVTILDLNQYKSYIQKYHIKDVVVGSMFTLEESNEVAPFSDNQNLFYHSNSDELQIIKELSKVARVYRRSTDVMNYYRTNLNI